MSEPIIQIKNLSKKYTIGEKASYGNLREEIMQAITSPFKRSHAPSSDNSIWALKEVSFDVEEGEVLGIIGKNGAGKSTLLKILSRITDPTKGEVILRGRVASLLEVGTGFHPELTGRENVLLNGALLGMTRQEIKSKFDEIVAFAEIEKFLDTPVKRYSSGMYVRLAFAVAAHLEPEILIIDEVLAVGDASFQKKCLGKMSDIAGKGRTVLFVSHNMGAVSRLCNKAILLHEGSLKSVGSSGKIVAEYLNEVAGSCRHFTQEPDNNIPLCLLEAEVVSQNGSAIDYSPRHNPITIRMKYRVNQEISAVHIYANVLAADGNVVMGTGDADTENKRFEVRMPGTYRCEFQIPGSLLNDGIHTVNISLGIPYQRNYQLNDNALNFTVVDVGKAERAIHRRRAGAVLLDIPWNYPDTNPFRGK